MMPRALQERAQQTVRPHGRLRPPHAHQQVPCAPPPDLVSLPPPPALPIARCFSPPHPTAPVPATGGPAGCRPAAARSGAAPARLPAAAHSPAAVPACAAAGRAPARRWSGAGGIRRRVIMPSAPREHQGLGTCSLQAMLGALGKPQLPAVRGPGLSAALRRGFAAAPNTLPAAAQPRCWAAAAGGAFAPRCPAHNQSHPRSRDAVHLAPSQRGAAAAVLLQRPQPAAVAPAVWAPSKLGAWARSPPA